MFKSSLVLGAILVGVFALIGFSVGTFKIPESNQFEITKKAGGLNIDEAVIRLIKFKQKKNRIYIYKGGK